MREKKRQAFTGPNVRSGRRDKESVAAFYDKHCARVYRVCMSFVRDPHTAADLMQDTFMRWLECKSPPRGEKHEIAWLVMTAGNLCRDYLRRQKKFGSDDIAKAYDIAAEDNSRRDSELLEAVRRLPEKYRTAVYLFYYEDMTTEQIAQYTKQRNSTVRSQLTRARELLRRELGDDLNE